MRHERSWQEHYHGDLRDKDTISDIELGFSSLIDQEGGQYSETLLVRPDGFISMETRKDRVGPPYLAALFTEYRQDPGKRAEYRGPSVEQFYQVISELAKEMPGFRFHIEEEPHRQWLRYTVTKDDSHVV